MPEALPATLAVVVAAVAAGVGAVCRLLLDGFTTALVARARRSDANARLPWGTLVVNLSGSAAVGVVAGLLTLAPGAGTALSHAALHAGTWSFVVVLGFISGYTTFSTASYQTVRLAQDGHWWAALANGLGQLLFTAVAVALCWAAVWLCSGSF